MKRAVAIDSTYARAWFSLGDLYRRTGRSEDAVDAYERGLRHKPRRPDMAEVLAAEYLRLGRPREAVLAARRGLEASPGDARLLFVLARAYHSAGDRAQALEWARRAEDLGCDVRDLLDELE